MLSCDGSFDIGWLPCVFALIGTPHCSRNSFHALSTPVTRRRLFRINLKVQIPVILAPRIEAPSTSSTLASTLHILLHAQDVLARSTKHCFLSSLTCRPDARSVGLTCIVAADAGVELPAAEVLDGDDVQRGVPVSALGQLGDVQAVDRWWDGVLCERHWAVWECCESAG